MSRPWTDDDKESLRALYPDRAKSRKQIAKELGRTDRSIKHMQDKLGLWRGWDDTGNRHTYWTNDDKARLWTLWPDLTLTVEQIAEALGKTLASIYQTASKLGISRGNCLTYDRETFSRHTPATAYWAGFLLADGCVQEYTIRLALSEKDSEHVESFRNFIKCSAPLRYYHPTSSVYLTVSSKTMATELARWGVIPNKTYVGTIPDTIPDELLPHYIRGLIDGDGGIYIRPQSIAGISWKIGLSNNRQVVSRVKDIIRNGVGCDAKTYDTDRGTGHIGATLSINRKPDVRKTLEWLDYAGDGPALPRKRAKAIEILSTHPDMIDLRTKSAHSERRRSNNSPNFGSSTSMSSG